jgi:hypothetical protein
MDALARIEAVATPHTIKYLLEIYEFLLPADPRSFIIRIADFIDGPAAQEAYQHELIAAGSIVKFVRWLLADYRSICAKSATRGRLIRILGTFVDAGWPETMRLMWELPDLLR